MPHLSRILDTVGDGSGTKSAVGNYSGAVTPFFIKPAANQIIRIHRMIVEVRDTGIFSAEKWGAAAGLTNGVSVKVLEGNGTTIADLTEGEVLKYNADWGRVSFDVNVLAWGVGDEFLVCRWSFDKFGGPIVLDGRVGQSFNVLLNDDMSGLVEQHFTVQGQISSVSW